LSCLVLLCWRAVPNSIHQIVHGFTPPPIQNQYVKQGMGGRRSPVAEDMTGVVLVASPEMRASPSTCRVLTIDWQVRGLYRCLWYARGLCLWGFTSLPTQEAKYSFLGIIPTNKKKMEKKKKQMCSTVVVVVVSVLI